jgi:hypothetical protein
MPNPHCQNDDAAGYVSYYASSAMEADLVKRLHTDAVSRKRLQQQNAELKADLKCPAQTRTPEEIDAYSKQAVYDELNRRGRHKAALEAEVYGNLLKGRKGCFTSKSEQESHLKSVYTDPFKKLRTKQVLQEEKSTYRKSGKNPDFVEKERWWKCSSNKVEVDKYPGRAYLVSDAPLLPSSWKKKLGPSDLENREQHWKALSKPLVVTQKVSLDESPKFTIYSKFRVTK